MNEVGEDMFSKLSIRKKLIISILLGCLIPFLIGGLLIKSKTEEWLYNQNVDNTNALLRQTAEHVDDSIIKNAKNLITMIAIDERVIHVDSKINSYVHYNPLDFKLRTSKSESEIMTYFSTIKKSYDMVTFVSFGTKEGGYIEYPAFNPTSPYDPRSRGWYIDSIDQNSPIVSEPYITKITKDLVVSIDKSVTLKNKKIGVASLSISLENIMKSINSHKFGKSGYINIISPNSVFINSPGNKAWLLKSIGDLKLDVFKNVNLYNGKSYEGKIDNVDKVFNVYISPYSGWKFISVVDKSEVLQHSKAVTNLLYIIFFMTLAIMLALILLISNYITKPILHIAGIIDKMATFKFGLYENRDFEIYTHQKDEIGEISRALNGMQENFVELKNNLSKMDNEIQNIDIKERSTYQLKLSEDNPFDGIVQSINGLLQKVHNYIAQIKQFNEEISCKNEMLTASEEELKAQLEEIDAQKEYIHFLADHDPLTNLPNRRMFNEKLMQVINNGSKVAVLLIDLDNFKSMNDTLGHLFGDKVLQHISSKLENIADKDMFYSRFGGDEFLLLYEIKDGNDDTLRLVKQLFEIINEKFIIDQIEVKIEFSIGISMFPKDSCDTNELIMYADLALYHVKNTGKNNYSFFDSQMAEHLIYKQSVKKILKEALENDGFKLVYQPQIEILTGMVTGYEALVRLKNHNLSPAEFIEIAEEDSTIISIGRIVTKLVLLQMSQWKQKGLALKPVAINFSAVQMQDHNYKNYLFELLDEYEISPENITIEITESIFLENKDTTIVFLNELKEHGIKIAVDDFGTGYSSLSYLTFLPIDTIKLDRALNSKFLELENIAVMDSLIALAHSLNLKVIAEGIEEKEQVKRLAIGKCDVIQGYYFSRPLEVEDVEKNYDKIYS
jgi:diguanylate cyclase (GGDEF)-like protein